MDYKEGDIVYGIVVGIKPYGAFVSIAQNITGLLHISEVSESYVKDINTVLQKNDSIKIKIIRISEDNQYVFSMKQVNRSKRKTFYNKDQKKQEKIMETPKGFTQLKQSLPKWIAEYQGD